MFLEKWFIKFNSRREYVGQMNSDESLSVAKYQWHTASCEIAMCALLKGS